MKAIQITMGLNRAWVSTRWLAAACGWPGAGRAALWVALGWGLWSGPAVAAPYPAGGKATAWVQPNGSHLELRVLGDEFYARTVTAAGYTVVFNAADQTYYYAVAAAGSHSLVPSGIAADKPPPDWLPTHLAEPPASVAEQRRKNIEKIAPHRRADWEALVKARGERRGRDASSPLPTPSSPPLTYKPAGGPTVDTKVGLVILVQFPDDPNTPVVDPVAFPTTQAKMNRLCNQVGYNDDGNIGSIHDYYIDQSNGHLSLTQVVTPILTLPHPRNFYSYSDYPVNTILRDNGATGDLMATDAVLLLKAAAFDFSTLSLDSFNDVIATSLLFAGADSGVYAKGLWPFSGSFPIAIDVGTAGVHKYILNYQMTDIADAAPGMGTTCHELGHMLKKYPDLYDSNSDNGASAGVGTHSLMGTGASLNNEKAPAPIDIYLKDFSGWATITDLTPTTALSAALPSTGNIGYRIRKPGTATEYFIIENRGAGDRWSAFCPDVGIMIWHVDEAVTTENEDQQMTQAQHYQCALMQADGRCDLEHNTNTGDNTDLFKTTKGIFNNATTPNANWWDGSASGISVTVPSAPAASMNVVFGAAPPTLALAPASQNVLAAGGTFSFQVTSNSTWTWSQDSVWLSTSVVGPQTGNLTFTLTVPPNTTIVPRTAVFTLNVAGGLTATHTLTQGGLLLPDLVVGPGYPSACGPAIVKPGGNVYVYGSVSNQGSVPTGPYSVNFYLSPDTTITTSDYLIGQKSQPSLAVGASEFVLMDDSTAPLTLTVPLTVPGGTYYAGWIYDPNNLIAEVNKNNNTGYVTGSTLIVDASPPTVAISSPAADGTTVTSPTLAVSGTAADNVSVASVYISLNGGSSVLVTGTTSWSSSVSLVPGTNTVAAIAVDTAGNQSSWITRSITYTPQDATKPTVAITSPAANGTYVNRPALTVSGTATKGTYDLNVVYCLLNSTLPWLTATGTSTWSRSVALTPGLNSIKAIVYDDQGVNSSQVVRTVTYDGTPPTVAITTPASAGTIVNLPSLAFAGTADDINLTAVYWRCNGGAWTLASGTSAWSGTANLIVGVNTIEVQSKDAANNLSTIVAQTLTYTPDVTPPTVAITSPASDGGAVNAASLAIAGTAADDFNLAAVYWRLNGGTWTLAGGTTAWSATVPLVVGANLIEVQSKDAVNNLSTLVSRTVTYDATPPTVAIATPAGDGIFVSSPGLALSGTAADNLGVAAVYWRLNGDVWVAASGTTSWSASVTLAAGAKLLEVQSKDAANNLSTIASRTIMLDSVAPTVTINTPAGDGLFVTNPTVAFSGTAADNLGVTAVYWRLNGGAWATTTGISSWSASVTLAAGANLLEVQSKDAANNLSFVASRTIHVDATPPTVAITTPASDGTIVTSPGLALSGTAADNLGVTAVYWRLNGGAWATTTGINSWSASLTLAAGANLIEVQSKDTANNLSVIASRTINFVAIPPTVAITTPAGDGTIVTSPDLALSGIAASNLGVSAVYWRLNGGPWATAIGFFPWSATVTLAIGANLLEVQSKDVINNLSAVAPRIVNYTPFGQSLPTWRQVHFGSAANSGIGADLADPDNDGVTNLQEFAFNLDPNVADAKRLVAGAAGTAGLPVVSIGDNGRLRIEFIRRKASNNPGVDYNAKFSADLSTWVDFTGAAAVTSIDAIWERLLVDDQLPASTPARFARVEVTNRVDASVLSPLESWRQANFSSSANSGDGADLNDFDHDGIPNLLEFAFGLNPKQNSAGLLPCPQISGGNLVLGFTQPAGISGITYGAEWSPTLLPGSWIALPDTGAPPNHLFSVPLGSNAKVFMRLNVSNP